MISVVVTTYNAERPLGETLSALVPAAIDGLVREVIVVDAGSTDDTVELAEDAGARVLRSDAPAADRIALGCAEAKGPWLLILPPDMPPPPGWEAAAHGLTRKPTSDVAWWAPKTWGGLLGRPPAEHALLISKMAYEAAGGYGAGGTALIKRVGRTRLKRLKIAPA